jgi:hypothetical protein
MQRRTFLQLGGAALAPFSSALGASKEKFYFAIIADTHIIDDFYTGSEDSIRNTTERLTAARDYINSLQPAMERVFVVGDYFHDYPSPDVDFYFQHKTRIDHAKALTDGFRVPVHIGFGNHDYFVPKVSRETSHELFRRKLGVKPYYAVEHKGFRFVHLNNFLGETWSIGPSFNKGTGSLGEEQLNWLEAELQSRKPTFVFVHYPLKLIAPTERADYGLHSLLLKYKDSVQRVVSGHWHKWVDFGRTYGPEHIVMSATRFDADAYLIVEVDTKTQSHRLLNLPMVEWDTHFSKPFRF